MTDQERLDAARARYDRLLRYRSEIPDEIDLRRIETWARVIAELTRALSYSTKPAETEPKPAEPLTVFKVERDSLLDDDTKLPIVPGAVRRGIVRVDVRTVDDPRKIPAYLGADPVWWYGEGTNHRVIDGRIARDFHEEAWTLEVRDAGALAALAQQEGCPVSIHTDPGGSTPRLIIKDG